VAGWAPPPLPARWRLDERQAFVGRQAEFEKLEGVWSAVSEGARQVVFVGGEPGSGKTRLAAEAARSLHRLGVAVLVGQCLADYGTAYQPFPEVIAALQPALDRLLPEEAVRTQLRRLVEPGALPDPAVDPVADQRRALFDAVVTLVGRAARDHPLVLVLEDLHWAGTSSLQLLAHLVGRLPEARLLVLATHRPTPPDRSEPLVAAIADLYRLAGVHRIDLAGLSTDDVTELLTRTTRLPVVRTRPVAAMLRDHTGGNPFFIWEMWHDIGARGGLESLRPGELPVPATVRDAVAGRLDTLDGADREVVELAAVAGDQLDLPLLLVASSRERDATLRAVDRAVELGLLEPGGDGPSYRFPHALARQAVLALIRPGRRAGNHARIATCLEERFTGATGEVERLAYHFSEAHGHGLHAKAREWLVAASRLAERGMAYAEAARHLEEAARFAADAADRQQLLLSAVDAYAGCADFARALELSGTVATEATDPATRLEAAIRFAEATPYSGEWAERAVSLLTGAIGPDQPATDPSYVRATASLGRALALSGAADEADQAGSRAIAMARELGRDDVLAHALMASLWNLLHPSTALRQQRRATEAAQLAERLGDLRTLGPASVFRAMYSYLVGDPESLAQSHAALDRVAERALPYYLFWAAEVAYGRRFLRGDFAAAQASARTARELGLRFSGDDTEGVFGLQTFLVRRETGQLDQVRPLVTGDERPQDHWAPGLLALYTGLGMRKPAERALGWLLAEELADYQRSAPWPAVLVFLVEGALALRDTEALRRLRPMLTGYGGRNLVAGHFAGVFGSGDRYLGCVDSALGTGDPDASFTAAAEMDARMGAVVHQTATMAAYAKHLRRRGRRGDARRAAELAAGARELAEPIGQGRVLRMLEPQRARATGGGPLTVREHEVLRLLAEGRSNREIAETLVITENTAANHVRSILLKTGAANRTQAVRHASSQGWLPAG
jgi:DNA-binding CsgD family transcriptional regulator